MTATSAFPLRTRCRKLFGLSKWPLKVLVFFAIGGGMYHLSDLVSREVGPAVVRLTEDNFDSLVSSSPEPWLVEFYATWCPHCKAFAGDYIGIGERLRGIVNVGSVDIDEERYLKLRFRVVSLPSFLIFLGNSTPPFLYRGVRIEDALVEAVLRAVGRTP